MLEMIFGTAHLFGVVPVTRSSAVLQKACEAGFLRFDTAPSYGFGQSEPAVGDMIKNNGREHFFVSTKVGIVPAARPARQTMIMKSVARRLPGPVQNRLRGVGPPGHGAFGVEQVRDSIETSLARLQHLDRLLLHEAHPADVTDRLLALLRGYVDRGDVGQLGVATQNALTAACLARAPELLTAVHVSLSPLDQPAAASAGTVVGHGLLGADGVALRVLQARLDDDARFAEAWDEEAGTGPYARPDGLVRALLARGAAVGADAVIVTTSRVERLPDLSSAASLGPLPAGLFELLGELRP